MCVKPDPDVIFSALPTSLAGQESLLRGLGVGQLLSGSPESEATCAAYWRLQMRGAALPVAELSRLIDGVLEGRPSPSLAPVPFHFRFQPGEVQPCVEGGAVRAAARPAFDEGRWAVAGTGQASEPAAPARSADAARELVALVSEELGRVVAQYRLVVDTLESAKRQDIEAEMALIVSRLQYWVRSLEEAEGQPVFLATPFREDIAFGVRVLLHRVFQLTAEVFSEPAPAEAVLPDVRRLEAVSDEQEASRFPVSLKNRDAGFGNDLSLREHQQFLLGRVQGLFRKMMMESVEARAGVRHREGTIVMAQGGGKTRTMIASFAAALQTGFFDPERGDKVVILNHTAEIHSQNLKVSRLLGPYFKKRSGRDLKVTEYKAGKKDLSGDVIVVSIPTVATDEARQLFEARLREALGERGRVPLVAVDEIHHLTMGQGQTKESWREMITALRRISPDLFRIGFTATPTGREGPYIGKIRLIDLMRSGVTPRTYLRQVEGVDLSVLKVSAGSEDISVRRLVSVLLQHPERNSRLYEALEKDGLRASTPSPSGRDRLEPSLAFAADLQHAWMMARDYASFFGGEGKEGLRGRRFALLGGSRGRIDPEDLEEVREAWRSGETDAILAIVSGDTSREMRDEILKGVERGEIEAVFNVDVWAEGADLYPFTHLLGARPTFSRIKKGQEMGRLNRRGPSDVGEDGRLISDRPKILFDIVDTLLSFERSLVFYANLLEADGALGAGERLFDLLNGTVVEEVDREGLPVVHRRLKEVMEEKKKRRRGPASTRVEPVWAPILTRLEEVLQTAYDGDLEAMALDLAMTAADLEDFLNGKGLVNARWFLRRVATLLFQPRESLVSLYNELRHPGDGKVCEEDVEILWGALAVYAKRELRPARGEAEIIVSGSFERWGEHKAVISQHAQWRLEEGAMTDRVFRQIWRGLYLYFHSNSGPGATDDPEDAARRSEAETWQRKLREHLFRREGWDEADATARQRLLLKAREGFALALGGEFPQKDVGEGVPKQLSHSSLNRWLAGEDIVFGRGLPPHDFYSQVQSLLRAFGLENEERERLVVEAVYEDQGWQEEDLSTPGGRLLATARRGVALRFGGRLPVNTGLPGVPQQYAAYHAKGRDYEGSPLTRWLNGEEITFSRGLTEKEFRRQVEVLLKGLGKSNFS